MFGQLDLTRFSGHFIFVAPGILPPARLVHPCTSSFFLREKERKRNSTYPGVIFLQLAIGR